MSSNLSEFLYCSRKVLKDIDLKYNELFPNYVKTKVLESMSNEDLAKNLFLGKIGIGKLFKGAIGNQMELFKLKDSIVEDLNKFIFINLEIIFG